MTGGRERDRVTGAAPEAGRERDRVTGGAPETGTDIQGQRHCVGRADI